MDRVYVERGGGRRGTKKHEEYRVVVENIR
jgi:hypothetical protein